MRKILEIFILMVFVGFLSGCSDKPSKIDKFSPCASYDIVKVG